jgi:hypothetical protein
MAKEAHTLGFFLNMIYTTAGVLTTNSGGYFALSYTSTSNVLRRGINDFSGAIALEPRQGGRCPPPA